MKHIIAFLFLAVCITSHAQTSKAGIVFGISGGTSFTEMGSDQFQDILSYQGRGGIDIGLSYSYPLNTNLYLNGRIIYAKRGYDLVYKFDESFIDDQVETDFGVIILPFNDIKYFSIESGASYHIKFLKRMAFSPSINLGVISGVKKPYSYTQGNITTSNERIVTVEEEREIFGKKLKPFLGPSLSLSYNANKFTVQLQYSHRFINQDVYESSSVLLGTNSNLEGNVSGTLSNKYLFLSLLYNLPKKEK